MALSLRIPMLVGLVCATHVAAAAQERVKESIFEDCENAKKEFAALDEPSRAPLFEYLSRVVALNAQSPDVAEAFVVLPGASKGTDVMAPGAPKGADLSTGGLWQAVDAKRELKAKRCALEILSLAGKSALSAVPSLAAIYHDQSLSDEIAVALEETIADIAEQAHKSGLSPSDKDLDAFIPHLVGARPLVARNILTEYLVIALPRILQYFSTATESAQDAITDFLRVVDPDGSRVMRTFIERAPALAPKDAVRMATKLPFPSRDALSTLTKDLATLAVGVESSEIFAPVLGRACLVLGKLNSEISQIIAPSSSLIQSETLDLDSLRCLVASTQSLARAVPALALSADQPNVDRGLALLSSALPHLDQEARNSTFSHLRGLAVRPGPYQSRSIPLLALFHERKPEALATYTQLLSGPVASSLDATPLRQEIFAALSEMELPKDNTKLATATRSVLLSDPENAAALKVAEKIQLTPSELISLVSREHPERSRAIVRLLAARKVTDKRLLSPLVELLRAPEVYTDLRPILLSYKATLAPTVRKILPKLTGNARLMTLSLLESSGSISKQELGEIVTLLMSDNCAPIDLIPDGVVTLLSRNDIQSTARSALEKKIGVCASEISTHSFEVLLAGTSGLAVPDNDALQKGLAADLVPRETISKLLDYMDTHEIPVEIRSSVLEWSLLKGDISLRDHALRSFRSSDSPRALSLIRTLASESPPESDAGTTSRIALARIGDTEYDWKDFIRSTIERAGNGEDVTNSMRVLVSLPAEMVLAEVGPALDSSSAGKVAGACQVGAALGQQAIPIVSKIWHLREKRTPSIRYAAVLALLQINPLTPDLQDHLRLILVNRYFDHALSRAIKWSQTVAVVDLQKEPFGTLRTVHLERLLAKSTTPVSTHKPQ
jgi:hypothetical protein